MKNYSLQLKILGAVTIAMITSMAISIYSMTQIYNVAHTLDEITNEDARTQEGILRATVAFKIQIQEWKNVLLRGKDSAALDKHWEGFLNQEKRTVDFIEKAKTVTTNEKIKNNLDKFKETHRLAGEGYRKGLIAYKENNDPEAGDRTVAGVDRAPTAALLDTEELAGKEGTRRIEEAMARTETVYRWSIGATIIWMLSTLICVWLLIRITVIKPIAKAVQISEHIAGGDLSKEIKVDSHDEIGKLMQGMKHMNDSLAQVVGDVRQAAESVATSSSQVAAGTTDLSQRTEEQASSLEETAASMEELSSTVKQTTDNVTQADNLARGVADLAEQGGEEVNNVIATMGNISDSAKRISDIITVIDTIAFQTNILALNAAVEAARAGEQGRGFAVVASEVRALAQRSAEAAKEIKNLISTSVNNVENGKALVEKAGGTIRTLVVDVKQVSEFMQAIAEASSEQNRGVQQVNKTVTEMDKVVQQNAGAVHQSATAAQDMRQQAESLIETVSKFKLNDSFKKNTKNTNNVEKLNQPQTEGWKEF